MVQSSQVQMDQRVGKPNVQGSLAELESLPHPPVDRGHEQSTKGKVTGVVAAVLDQPAELGSCLAEPSPLKSPNALWNMASLCLMSMGAQLHAWSLHRVTSQQGRGAS